MMLQEFIDRTGYTPREEINEYRFIEQSYYDFDGDKDEFCKQWKKDKKDGHWDRELKLRMMHEVEVNVLKEKIKEQEDSLDFYRRTYEEAQMARTKLKTIQRVLEGKLI